MEVNERISLLVKTVYGNQSNAARALKVSRQRINAVVGGLKPGLDFYFQLSDNIEKLNLNWLMRGEGPMFVNWDDLTVIDNIVTNTPKDRMIERIINIWEAERKQWDNVTREHTEMLKEIKMNQQVLLDDRKKKAARKINL